jgi:hypothetical protein
VKFIFTSIILLFCCVAYPQFVASRQYAIMTKSTGKQLNAASLSNATVRHRKDSWFIISNGDGTYRLQDASINQVLGIRSSSTDDGAIVDAQVWANLGSQKWTLDIVNNFYYKITNVKSGRSLTVRNEFPTTTDPNPDIAEYNYSQKVGDVVQNTYASLDTQLFQITPVKVSNEEILAVPLLGWAPEMTKKALLILNTPLVSAPNFTVKNNLDNSVVLSGAMTLYVGTKSWGQRYYEANLSSITTEGDYIITANGFTASFKIAKNIYTTLQGPKGSIVSYQDLFNGFWEYNKYDSFVHTLPKARLTMLPGLVETFAVDGTFNMPTKGWFDAHSRDSKTARTAKVVADFCLAYINTKNSGDRSALANQIRFGFENLLAIQNTDGSWPLGKIREESEPRINYYWCINKDAYTTARAVKALALGYQVFKDSNPTYAAQLLSAAVKGWSYVSTNEDVVIDLQGSDSWKGSVADYFAAAVEMAYATGESVYFDKADYFCTNGKYQSGIFRHRTSAFYGQLTFKYNELDTGTAVSIARYADIARTPAIKAEVTTLINDLVNYYNGFEKDAFGIPSDVFGSTGTFGKVVFASRMANVMLGIHQYTGNVDAKNMAISLFNVVTGLNPFHTSYVQGIGAINPSPSASFFKRSYDFGSGAILPGFHNNGTTLEQDYSSYETTEGVIPTCSALFYMLTCLNNIYNPTLSNPSTGYNGDFEQGVLVKWNLFKNATSDATFSQSLNIEDIYNGSKTAKVDVTTLTTPSYDAVKLFSNAIDIEPGKKLIDVSLFSKASSPTCDIKIAINFYDVNNALISTFTSGAKTLTTSFSQLSVSNVDVPLNTTNFVLELRTGQVLGSYYYDDVVISQNLTLSNESTFYHKGSGSLSGITNWGINPDGSGTKPTDLLAANTTYVIKNGSATTDSSWTLGAGSKVVVGAAGSSPVTLTVANTFPIVGTIDIDAASSRANSVVWQNGSTTPSFGTLHSTSEVRFAAAGTYTFTNTPVFGKLFIDTSGVIFANTQIIQTSLTVESAGVFTVPFSAAQYMVLNNGASVTINGTLRGSKLAGFFSYGVGTPGTTFASLQFKDAVPSLTLGSSSTIEYARASNIAISTQIISILPPDVNYSNLTLSEVTQSFATTKTILGPIAVTGKLTVSQGNAGSVFNTGGFLTLKSTATQTAVVAPIAGTVTIAGNVTVERYIPAGFRQYRLLSPATTGGTIKMNWQEGQADGANLNAGFGTHITGTGAAANGFDTTTTNEPSLFTHNNTGASTSWTAVANTNVNSLTAGFPYLIYIRGSRQASNISSTTNDATTLKTIGALRTGTVAVTALNATADGFSLIGNPYQAQVDMKSVLLASINLVQGFYYVLNPANGAYSTFDFGLNTGTSGNANQYLQPGQACFVKTKTATVATPTLSFLETNKSEAATQTSVFRIDNTATSLLRLSLFDTAKPTVAVDGLIVAFDGSETNAVNENDASKLNNFDENIATLNGGKLLSIEKRAIPADTDEIPLDITKYKGTSYSIKAESSGLTGSIPYLFDAYANKTTDIPQNGTVDYTYTVDTAIPASIAANRFKIIYTNKSLKAIDNAVSGFALYPNPAKTNSFTIVVPQSMPAVSLTVSNLLGQKLYSQNDLQSGTTVKVDVKNVNSNGVYLVRLTSNGKTATIKWIVE